MRNKIITAGEVYFATPLPTPRLDAERRELAVQADKAWRDWQTAEIKRAARMRGSK